MYTLKDYNGKFICCIDSDPSDRKIILRDMSRRAIGYGVEETHAIRAGTVHLFMDDGTPVGTLDRELGLDGRPDCVRFSGEYLDRSIPVKEFQNRYILEVLFSSEYVKNMDLGQGTTETSGTSGTSATPETPETSGMPGPKLALFIVMLALSLTMASILRKTILSNTDYAEHIVGLYAPVLMGSILFLICLFHRGGGLSVRLAGLAEGVCSGLVFRIVIWLGFHGGAITDHLFEAWGLDSTDGFLDLIKGFGFIFLQFVVMMLPHLVLAVIFRIIFRIISPRIRVAYEQEWLKRLNQNYHTAFLICGAFLFFSIFLIVGTETLGQVFLLGFFYGIDCAVAAGIVRWGSKRILGVR